MNRFVLDSSVTMSWCFADEGDSYAMSALDALTTCRAVVPWLWPLEVANVLLVGERHGRIKKENADRFLTMLGTLPIDIDGTHPSHALGNILTLGRQRGLSAYDASYVDLAQREGLALATLDERLRRVATELGLALVTFR